MKQAQLSEHLSRLAPEEAVRFLAYRVHQVAATRWCYLTFLGLPVVLIFATGYDTAAWLTVGCIECLLLLPVLGGIVSARIALSEQVLRQVRELQLIARLSSTHSVLALLELIDALSWPRDDSLRHWWWGAIYPILARGLPLLPFEDFDDTHRRALAKLLHLRGKYPALQVAALLALSTAGGVNRRVVRDIRWLFLHSESEHVREAARDCLLMQGKIP